MDGGIFPPVRMDRPLLSIILGLVNGVWIRREYFLPAAWRWAYRKCGGQDGSLDLIIPAGNESAMLALAQVV